MRTFGSPTTRYAVATAIALAVFVAGPSGATAQQGESGRQATLVERAQALYLEGMDLYRAGKYQAAIARFQDAYGHVQSPKLVYNIARSYEAFGRVDEAMKRYLRCAGDPKASETLRQKALRRIRMIERARRRSAAAPQDPTLSPPMTVQATVPPNEGPTFLSISKWVGTSASLGLLGAGAAFVYLGFADEAELDDARTADGQVSSLTRTEAQALADQAEERKLLGTIMLGAGGALAVTSLILFLVDGEESEEDVSNDTTVTWTPIPQGGLVGVSTRF